MSNIFSFDGYSAFCDWCEENGYDPDAQHDRTQEPHKQNIYETFYIKSLEGEKYMMVFVETSFAHGWLEGEIELVPLTRKVEQVVMEKVSYVEGESYE
jgi:hypothetical protein